MSRGSVFRCFADVIGELEKEGYDISAISSRTETGALTGELSLETGIFPDSLDVDGVSLAVTDVQVDGDTVTADISVHLEEENDLCSSGTTAGSVEAYKDPDQLRRVYERYDTFPAMTEALGVDVTPKTVRNYMVKHGIHDPEVNKQQDPTGHDTGEGRREGDTRVDVTAASGGEGDDGEPVFRDEDTSSPARASETAAGEKNGDADSAEEVLLPDGSGFPPGVTLPEIRRSVQSAATLHDVSRELGLEQERARDLLGDLNLLEFVFGRLVNESHQEVSAEEIDERIRTTVGREVA